MCSSDLTEIEVAGPVSPLRWGYNTMADVISHRASECTVCKDYVLHVSEVSMDNDESYLDAFD